MALHNAVWGAKEHRQTESGRAYGESVDAMAAAKDSIENLLRLLPFAHVGHVRISASGHCNPYHGEPREEEYVHIHVTHVTRAKVEEAGDAF